MINPLTQDSNVSLELKRLFYQLKLSQPETKEFSTLMITSAGRGEGKSVFSLAMALGIAKEKEEDCLLVDANWMNPVLDRYFGLPREHTLQQFWNEPLECIRPSGIEHLDILSAPKGVEVDTADEFVKSEVIRGVFERLSSNYTTVVFDTSPILKNIQQYGNEPGARNLDSLILSDFVKISILVIMARVTNKQRVKKAKFELQKDSNQVWAVLNNYKNPFYN